MGEAIVQRPAVLGVASVRGLTSTAHDVGRRRVAGLEGGGVGVRTQAVCGCAGVQLVGPGTTAVCKRSLPRHPAVSPRPQPRRVVSIFFFFCMTHPFEIIIMAEGGREGRDGGEILTVQAGNYANQIGAHYWNNQVNSPAPSLTGPGVHVALRTVRRSLEFGRHCRRSPHTFVAPICGLDLPCCVTPSQGERCHALVRFPHLSCPRCLGPWQASTFIYDPLAPAPDVHHDCLFRPGFVPPPRARRPNAQHRPTDPPALSDLYWRAGFLGDGSAPL